MTKTFGILLSLLMVLAANPASAYNSYSCAKTTNNGFFRAYKYEGPIGSEAYSNESTQATKSEGTTKGYSTDVSTERSTYTFDPGGTTHQSTSSLNYTSSSGDCSVMGMQQNREERDHFIALNSVEIKKEIAIGQGSFLALLAEYTLCDANVVPEFNRAMKSNFDRFIDAPVEGISTEISHVLNSSPSLKSGCGLI